VCNVDVTVAVTTSQTILLSLPGRSATLPHDPVYVPASDTIILKAGPKPFPKRALHIGRSRVSSFK
jgi:hypothetical protein